MSLRFVAGNAFGTTFRHLLSRRWFPLFRTQFIGSEWAYDVCRHAGTRNLQSLLDVGANTGQTARYLGHFFPRSDIHCFELSSRTAAILRNHVRRLPKIKVHAKALGAMPGRVRVKLQDDSVLNSLRFATESSEVSPDIEDVEVTTVDAFCAAENIGYIDVLKTDAQGFDLQVLQGAAGMIGREQIAFVFTEVSFDENQHDSQHFRPIHAFLTQSGFHLCRFYDQWAQGTAFAFCNALYCHPGALEILRRRVRLPAPSR